MTFILSNIKELNRILSIVNEEEKQKVVIKL